MGNHQFQVSDREPVQPYVPVFFQPRHALNVLKVLVLGFVEVVQNDPGGNDPVGQTVDAKPFQRVGFEMLREVIVGKIVGEGPVVEGEGVEFIAKKHPEFGAVPFAVEHFRGVETLQQLVDVGRIALRDQEFARRNIQERHPEIVVPPFAEMHRRQVVVASPVKYVVIERNAGRDQLRHPALHNAFGHCGVFQLVADGHAFARPHQFGQVSVERVVGETGQFFVRAAVVAFGEGDAQNTAGFHRIFAEGLVEIAHPKKQ